jgi:hypothetical protein
VWHHPHRHSVDIQGEHVSKGLYSPLKAVMSLAMKFIGHRATNTCAASSHSAHPACCWAFLCTAYGHARSCADDHTASLQPHTCNLPTCLPQNEADIATALRDACIPRSSVFITSKVSPYQQGTDKASTACADILARLGTDYVDLMLIHWPGVARLDAQSPDNARLRLETWRVSPTAHHVSVCSLCASNLGPVGLDRWL